MASAPRKVAVLWFKSTLGLPSLRVTIKKQARRELPRGQEHHKKDLQELGEEERLQEQPAGA